MTLEDKKCNKNKNQRTVVDNMGQMASWLSSIKDSAIKLYLPASSQQLLHPHIVALTGQYINSIMQ